MSPAVVGFLTCGGDMFAWTPLLGKERFTSPITIGSCPTFRFELTSPALSNAIGEAYVRRTVDPCGRGSRLIGDKLTAQAVPALCRKWGASWRQEQ
jgi:hypothetical protein